jgi:hypothetical protein
MLTVTAVVRNGRMVIEEPTRLPEGTVLQLTLVEPDESADWKKLDGVDLEAAWAEEQLSEIVSVSALLERLESRGSLGPTGKGP